MNIKKYKGREAYAAIRHDLDFKTRLREQHIDTSIDNFYIAGAKNSDEAIKKYCDILNSIDTKKSDSVTLGSIICTLPKDFNGDSRGFFFDITKALTKKVGGEENVLYAVVHIDEPEAQPHLEFKFCPVIKGIDKRCKDKNKVLKKLCWDKLCDRNFYINLHKDIQAEVGEKYNCKLVNEITINDSRRMAKKIALASGKEEDWQNYYKAGNKSIRLLKTETARDLIRLKAETEKLQLILNEQQKELETMEYNFTETITKNIPNFITDDNYNFSKPEKVFESPIFSVNKKPGDMFDSDEESSI